MKKFLTVFLSALLILLLLPSCGEKEPDAGLGTESGFAAESDSTVCNTTEMPKSEKPAFTSSEQNEPVEEVQKPAALTFGEVQAAYPNKTVLTWAVVEHFDLPTVMQTEKINEYLDSLGKSYAVCFVPVNDFTGGYTTYRAAVEDMIAGGADIDIIYGRAIPSMVFSGIYAPITDYLKDSPVYSLMPRNYWLANTIGGEIYTMGDPEELIGKSYTYYVNKELSDKYGYDLEKPVLEQLDILEAVNGGEKCSVFVTSGYMYYPSCFINTRCFDYGAYWSDEDNCAKCIFDSKDYIERLKIVYTLKQLGYASYTKDNMIRDKVFIYAIPSVYKAETGDVQSLEIKRGIQDEYYRVDIDKEYILQNVYTGNGVASISKHKDEAFDLLATAYSDPVLNNLLAYGAEGENYILENGQAKVLDYTWRTACFANKLICLCEKVESPDRREILRDAVENAHSDEAIGFKFKNFEISEEIAAVNDVMYSDFQNTAPLAKNDFDEMIAEYRQKLYDAGLQTIIDEVNSQYKDWSEMS